MPSVYLVLLILKLQNRVSNLNLITTALSNIILTNILRLKEF